MDILWFEDEAEWGAKPRNHALIVVAERPGKNALTVGVQKAGNAVFAAKCQ